MEMVISKHSGFCFGVKRAVSLTKDKLKKTKNKKIYSLGPLIHNNWVVTELSREGLKVIDNLKGVERKCSVILPSHGVDAGRLLKYKEIDFVDTTCPFVFKAQTLIKKLADDNYEIVILGDKNHPEVKGLVGISKGKAKVLESEADAESFVPKSSKIALMSQTTQAIEHFTKISEKFLSKHVKELRIFNTICKDALDRQHEARQIANRVDAMLVIGGKNSANTKRLTGVCNMYTRTYHIESESEIKKDWFVGVKKIGVITGASTPGSLIEKVKTRIRKMR